MPESLSSAPPISNGTAARRIEKTDPPYVRLAYGGDDIATRTLAQECSERPTLLVSYAYFDSFARNRSKIRIGTWVLDSGAFTAFKAGTSVDVAEYADACFKIREAYPDLTEIFSLDVIGDWRGTARNTEYLWKRGLDVIPVYHLGEPVDLLHRYAEYPKLALGGHAHLRGVKRKSEWMRRCFDRVWPKKIHGFGVGAPQFLELLPFHSVDASSWELGPCKFGRWLSLGRSGQMLRVRGTKNLRAEVEYYLAAQRAARSRWAKEMALLEGR